MCNNCIHKAVCSKFAATGGHVRECEHFKEARRSMWLKIPKTALGFVARCMRCGCPQDYEHNYCPNCGADMRGAEDGK